MWIADLGNGRYKNPILYADYSAPDAIRVGDDYFMISSSFSNAPAMPLLHSKDLGRLLTTFWLKFQNSDIEIQFMDAECGHLP